MFIDHHDAADLEARFVAHRESIGVTATILTEYARDLDIDIEETLATALFLRFAGKR